MEYNAYLIVTFDHENIFNNYPYCFDKNLNGVATDMTKQLKAGTTLEEESIGQQ